MLLLYIFLLLCFTSNRILGVDPELSEQLITLLNQVDPDSSISDENTTPHKYNVRSPYRWLVPRDTSAPLQQLIEDDPLNISLDDDGPDFWDVVAWLGTQVGRAVRLMCNAIIRLSKAIYVGVMYGWNEGRATANGAPSELPSSP